jgi:hypothetical protein
VKICRFQRFFGKNRFRGLLGGRGSDSSRHGFTVISRDEDTRGENEKRLREASVPSGDVGLIVVTPQAVSAGDG